MKNLKEYLPDLKSKIISNKIIEMNMVFHIYMLRMNTMLFLDKVLPQRKTGYGIWNMTGKERTGNYLK